MTERWPHRGHSRPGRRLSCAKNNLHQALNLHPGHRSPLPASITPLGVSRCKADRDSDFYRRQLEHALEVREWRRRLLDGLNKVNQGG